MINLHLHRSFAPHREAAPAFDANEKEALAIWLLALMGTNGYIVLSGKANLCHLCCSSARDPGLSNGIYSRSTFVVYGFCHISRPLTAWHRGLMH